MHRTWPERWAEEHLRTRRRQETAEWRDANRRRRSRDRVEQSAPGPYRRAVAGELIEDLAKAAATIWRTRST